VHARQVLGILLDELSEKSGIAHTAAVLEPAAEQGDEVEAVRASDTAHAVTDLTHDLEVAHDERLAQRLDIALAVIQERRNKVVDRPFDQRMMLEPPPHAHISPQPGAKREGTPSRARYLPDWKTSFAQRKATTAAGTPQ